MTLAATSLFATPTKAAPDPLVKPVAFHPCKWRLGAPLDIAFDRSGRTIVVRTLRGVYAWSLDEIARKGEEATPQTVFGADPGRRPVGISPDGREILTVPSSGDTGGPDEDEATAECAEDRGVPPSETPGAATASGSVARTPPAPRAAREPRRAVSATTLPLPEGRVSAKGHVSIYERPGKAGIERTYVLVDGKRTVATVEGTVGAAVLSPRGRSIAVRTVKDVRVFDAKGNELKTKIPEPADEVALSDDGKTVAAIPVRNRGVIDVVTPKAMCMGVALGGVVRGHAVSRDGKQVLAWMGDGQFLFFDPQTCTFSSPVTLPGEGLVAVTSVVVRDDGLAAVGAVRRSRPSDPNPQVWLVQLDRSGVRWSQKYLVRERTISASLPRVRELDKRAFVAWSYDGLEVFPAASPRPAPVGGLTARAGPPGQIEPPNPIVPTAYALLAGSAAPPVWPLEPPNRSHAVASTIEYVKSKSGAYVHPGIDLPSKPFLDGIGYPHPKRNRVVASVGGSVISYQDDFWDFWNENANTNEVVILGDDGKLYRYAHLAWRTVTEDVVGAFLGRTQGARIKAGTPLAYVGRWPDCGFHHLHFEVARSRDESGNDVRVQGTSNPLEGVSPRDDTRGPEIRGIWFCKRDPGTGSEPCGPNLRDPSAERVPVSGVVNIVVDTRDAADTDSPDVSSSHDGPGYVGVRSIRCAIRPVGDSGAREEEICNKDYSSALIPWSLGSYSEGKVFSASKPCVSQGDYCDPNSKRFCYLVTGSSDTTGWDSRPRNGRFTLTVTVTDFAGNPTTSENEIEIDVDNSDVSR